MSKEYQSEQQKLNARARKLGFQINEARGYFITQKDVDDPERYHVSTNAELHALIESLEKMAVQDVS